MGTAIKATAVSTDQRVRSSLRHSALAATECLTLAGITPDQVDVLINTGVYRDSNMFEPAMSALIQKQVGMNPDYVKSPTPKAGFSFDLMNGACGVLNAVQVAGGFLASGGTDHVLVVSGDTHPDVDAADDAEDFPYATMGAAMLLHRIPDADTGFGRVHTSSSSDPSTGARGFLATGEMGTRGRQRITVEQAPDYVERLMTFAATSARQCVEAEDIDLTRTLLISSRPTPEFGVELGRRLGMAPGAVMAVDQVGKDPHTSALTLGYHHASLTGRHAEYDQVLFVAAGAGLTATCAVYRPSHAA